MGLSRDTFYRYKSAVNDGGVYALLESNRKKPNIKNRIDPAIETAVVAYAIDFPAHGQVRVSNELRKQGVFVSARCACLRSDWYASCVFAARPRSSHNLSTNWSIASSTAIMIHPNKKTSFMNWHLSISTHRL